MALPVNITGLSTAVAPVGPFKLAAGTYSAAAFETVTAANTGGPIVGGSGTQEAQGQSLTNSTGAPLTIGSIDAIFYKTGTPTDSVFVEITSTNINGTVLATSDNVAAASVTATTPIGAPYTRFTFTSPPTIASGATFAVRVKRTGLRDATNTLTLCSSNSLTYAGGSSWVLANGTWSAGTTDCRITVNSAITVASDSYYFFGRDGTTATTLRAFKATDPTIAATNINFLAGTYSGGVQIGQTTSTAARCQGFTTPAGSSQSYTSVQMVLNKVGSPSDNTTCDIYTVDGALKPLTLIGSAMPIASSSLPTTDIVTTFIFPTPLVLNASTQYAVVVGRSGAIDIANYVNWRWNTSDTYAGGGGGALNTTAAPIWTIGTNDYPMAVFADGWAAGSTKTGFTTAILHLWGYMDSSYVVHMVVCDGVQPTPFNVKYVSYNLITDTWLATTETILSAASIAVAPAQTASIVVRSNGEVVAFYQGAQTKTSGTFYARVYYSRRTAVNTWSAAVEVDAVPATHTNNPLAIIGPNSDRIHFAFCGASQGNVRTLSAANVLSAVQSFSLQMFPLDGVAYDRGGVTKVVLINGQNASCRIGTFNGSADTPSGLAIVEPAGMPQSMGYPWRLGVDGTTVTAVGRYSVDSDLYSLTSTDDGATWSAPASFFVGNVPASSDSALSRQSNSGLFTRGKAVTLPYVVNDNGSFVYNENIVRYLATADAWNLNDKHANITLTNADKTATCSTSGNVGLRSTQSRSNGVAGTYYAEFFFDSTPPDWVGVEPMSANLYNGSNSIAVSTVNGVVAFNGASLGVNVGGALAAGDTLCMAWNTSTEQVWFRKSNGNWNNNSSADPSSGVGGANASAALSEAYALWAVFSTKTGAVTVRTRLSDLGFTAPAGFTSWMGEVVTQADAWNASDTVNVNLTNGDRTATATSLVGGVRSTTSHSSGKYYLEMPIQVGSPALGLKEAAGLVTSQSTNSVYVWPVDGTPIINGSSQLPSLGAFVANDVLCVAWDADTKRIWFRRNNDAWFGQGGVGANPETGVSGYNISALPATLLAWFGTNNNGNQATIRTRKADFTQTTPTGFLSWMGETLITPDYGALTSSTASLSGIGTVQWPPVTGTGTLTTAVAAITSQGISDSIGTGALTILQARYNIAKRSEELDQAPWFRQNVTTTVDAAMAPNSTMTADRLNDGTAYNQHYAGQTFNASVSGEIHTCSVYAKAETLSWFQLQAGTNVYANFNVATGVVGLTGSLVTATTIEAVGNGWYRCSLSAPLTSNASAYLMLLIANVAPVAPDYTNYQGTNSTMLFWGLQVEYGNVLTAYIPTTSNIVVINQGAPSLTGIGLNGWSGFGALDVSANREPMGRSITYLANFGNATTSWPQLGESFIATADKLNSIGLCVLTFGSPTDGVYLQVYNEALPATTLGPPSNIIAVRGTVSTFYNFTFNPPISLVPGNTYSFAIARTGAIDAANYYRLRNDGNVYAGGTLLRLTSGTWATDVSYDTAGWLDLTANYSRLTGVGTVVSPAATGTGTLTALSSVVTSVGISGSSNPAGSTPLQASASTITGYAALAAVTGTGTLVSAQSQVTGVGKATVTGTGTLQASASSLTASGVVGLSLLRPNGDIVLGGWTDKDGGTANIYQSIDETVASDVDYIQSPGIADGGTPTKMVTSFTPGADRWDFGGLVGFTFVPTIDMTISAIGMMCGVSHAGMHNARINKNSDADVSIILASVSIDLTNATPGVFYYAPVTPVNLIAGTAYSIMRTTIAYSDQTWYDVGPTTCADVTNIVSCIAQSTVSGGIIAIEANKQYSGMDLQYVPKVAATRGVADLKVRLMQGTTQIVEWSHADISDTFATVEQTLTTPQFAAITNFANLEVEFNDNKGNVYRSALSNPISGIAQPVKVRYRYRKLVA